MTAAPTRFGLTWWGERWIGALEALGAAYANRLPRGRTYARKGTVHDLAIDAGEVTARVTGSRPTPYRVRLRLPVFSDPFLLPALRGRSKDAILAELRAARAGGEVSDGADEADERPGLASLQARELFRARGDLGAIAVQPRPVADPAATVRRLGEPPGADAEVVEALVTAAAEHAWRIASGSRDADDDPDPELTEAVGAHEPATSAELAEALGCTREDVRARLRPLLAIGLVRRTGHARGTRYWT